MSITARERFNLRKDRVRKKIFGTSKRPRMSVFRSNRGIFVQIIDDQRGVTVASASTLSKDIREKVKGMTKVEQAKIVGVEIAKRASEAGITSVVFDRRGYKYHGRIKGLADAARAAGLKF